MRCEKCQFENEEDAKFCESCGASLVASGLYPPAVEPASPSGRIHCPSCGSPNEAGSIFCDKCGSNLMPQTIQYSQPTSDRLVSTGKKTSWAWWLMPIFLTWLGGLIGWLVVKENDKSKARRLLWTGIALTVLWLIFVGINFSVLYILFSAYS